MPEPATATAGGFFLAKFVTFMAFLAFIATALGFAVAWPKDAREAFARFSCALVGSFIVGGPFTMWGYHTWPWYFTDMATLVELFFQHYQVWGMDPSPVEARIMGYIMASAPFLVAAALPFWWLSRATVLWFERRKNKDIGEMARDGRQDFLP